MIKNLLATVLLLASFATAYCQTTVHTFTFGGQTRSYRVYLPTGFNASNKLPLVLNLHGLGSNAQQEELYTLFDNLGDTAHCVVVYPDGINNQWNIVVNCTGSTSPCTGIDDVGFISALIDTIHANYNIDLGRVYSTGMSDGAFMSFRLACELSCRIAAIAPVAGLLQEAYPLYPQCNPTRKMPVMQFHGTADSTVPYTNNPPYASVASTVSRWKTINSCPSNPVVTNLPDINNTDGCTATENYYGLCGDSTLLIQYTINGGAHTWPSSNPLAQIGVTNRDISANSLMWNFFKQYSTEAGLTFSGLTGSYCADANPVALTGTPTGGTFSGTGVTGTQFDPTAAGAGTHVITYSVTANGCTYTTTQNAVVTVCTGEESIGLDNLVVYPNPAANVLNVKFNNAIEAVRIILYDVTGRNIVNSNLADHAEKVTLNIAELPAGLYYLRLETGGERLVRKVVIER